MILFVDLNETFEVDDEGTLYHNFVYDGRLDIVYDTDKNYARMPALSDVDATGKIPDLFVSHRYPDFDSTGLTKYLRGHRKWRRHRS